MPPVTKSKYMVNIEWGDVPHLSPEAMEKILASTPPYLRDARSKGDPALGAGLIYPVPLSDILVDPFQLPTNWPRWYGLDVGWKRTATLWHAQNPDDGTIYAYAEHYRGEAEPSVHAAAILARGEWIPGAIDPAARGRNMKDGKRLIEDYREQGLTLYEADNAVSAGLERVWEQLSTGRYKIFRTCQSFQNEYRVYRRDEKGAVVKKNDHMMDASRYAIMTREIAMLQPSKILRIAARDRADPTAGY